MKPRYDVVVIGGGPAGSSAASFLAQKGYEVAILDKARHPRFTVGESILPLVWRFFDLLGVSETIQAENFVKKQGGTVVWGGKIRQLSFSNFGFDRPGLHVERDRMDFLLLENSRRLGVSVFEETTVNVVEFDGAGETQRVHFTDNDSGEKGVVACAYVVDASGQAAILSRQFKTRQIDEDFRFASMWAYFDNSKYVAADGKVYPFSDVMRVPPTTYVGSLGRWGWSWHIPLRKDTSIGIVIPIEDVKENKRSSQSSEEFFLRKLHDVPHLDELLSDAQLIENSFHVIRDYSYRPTCLAGPGFYILGDAAAFVDPIFSVGVVLALYSGHLSAWAIDRSLRDPTKAASSQSIYESQFNGRYEISRSLAIPGSGNPASHMMKAENFLKFQSEAEQDLMYTAALLTTRSENFQSISGDYGEGLKTRGKYRELARLEF